MGAHAPPTQGGEKNLGAIYRENYVSAPPAEQESILGHFAGRGRFEHLFSNFRPSFEG